MPGIEAPPGRPRPRSSSGKFASSARRSTPPSSCAELYADLIGRKVTLQQVYDLAQRITAKYGSDGYVLSRAIVPPQELDPNGAVVRIQVIEGYIDRVEWPPQLAAYRDFFSHYAAKITAERPVNINTLERYLLLAGDLPGLKFKNSLKPHPTKPGAATLVVEVTREAGRLLRPRRQSRHQGARARCNISPASTVNNWLRMHES